MDEAMRTKLALFVSNAQNKGKRLTLQDPLARRLAALLYAFESKAADFEAIRRCITQIKEDTRVFSAFRGYMAPVIAALLSLSEDPERLLDNTLDVYNMLRECKFRNSDYLTVAAYQIASGTDSANYPLAVKRTKAFYDKLKEYRWFYAGQDDYAFMAMLGMSDMDPVVGMDRIKHLYDRLKSGFRDKNSILALAQILVFSKTPDKAADRALALRDELKSLNLRYDRSYSLPSLGVLALLPADVSVIVQDLVDARDYLRMQKGFSRWSVTMQELLLYTAAIIGSEYSGGNQDGILTAALSTCITNIIIAQQVAVIVAVNAGAAAAAASSSH